MTGGEFDAVGARPSPVCSAATPRSLAKHSAPPPLRARGSTLWEREKVRGGATKDFGRFRGGVVGGGVFVWASGFRAGGPVWGYLT